MDLSYGPGISSFQAHGGGGGGGGAWGGVSFIATVLVPAMLSREALLNHGE